jgi:nucleoside-diphosphate kinase
MTTLETISSLNIQTTLVIIKPDAMEAGNAQAIMTDLQAIQLSAVTKNPEDTTPLGLKIVTSKEVTPTLPTVQKHYAEHLGRDFYPSLCASMAGKTVTVLLLRGPSAISAVRGALGNVGSEKAAPVGLRGKYGSSTQKNAIHASDSVSAASCETALWFPELIDCEDICRI